jgi:perosamine synthetase
MSLNVELLASKIKSVLPNKDFFALHEPSFVGNEKKYVTDCIETGWVSSVGSYVDLFEKMLAEYTGVKRAIAVVNGTAALHISLKLAGVECNDEVLIPALTFVATGNAVIYCNAIPHFIDVSTKTLGIDVVKLEEYLTEITDFKDGESYNKHTGRRIKAVVPMHTFGHPVDMDPLVELCNQYCIEIVEDAAESLGSYYKGIHTGNFGKVAAMSFNGNKTITTGGGGAILTNDEDLATYAKHITTTAKIPHRWEFVHDEIAYNYRMPNINAALGCAQLESLDIFLKKKRILSEKYAEALKGFEGIEFFQEPSFVKSNYWLNVIRINNANAEIRDNILNILNQSGIMSRPVWEPINDLSMYKRYPKMNLDTTNTLKYEIINIPSSQSLVEELE